MTADGLVAGADGALRCAWAGSSPEYLRYHDEEWGRPVHGDRALFERVTLEAFQSGLAWITILRKREGFRAAFSGFDPDLVAAYGPEDLTRLLADAGIVRNRAKIEAAVANARATVALREAYPGGLDALVWSFAPPPRPRRPRRRRDPRGDAGVDGVGEGAEASWLRVRGPDDGLRDDAGRRPRRRPHRRLLRAGSSRVGPAEQGVCQGSRSSADCSAGHSEAQDPQETPWPRSPCPSRAG